MFIQVRIDLSFVPDVISRCQHIDSPVKQFVCDFRGNTEPRRRILAIEDGEIDPVFLLEMFEVLADDAAACASDRVADKEDFHVLKRKYPTKIVWLTYLNLLYR